MAGSSSQVSPGECSDKAKACSDGCWHEKASVQGREFSIERDMLGHLKLIIHSNVQVSIWACNHAPRHLYRNNRLVSCLQTL